MAWVSLAWRLESAATEGVFAVKGFGGLVIPGHEGDGVFGAEVFAPFFPKPLRMRVEEGRVEFAHFADHAGAGVRNATQNGVDEAANGRAGAVDGFVDGGVVGKLQNDDLANADAEDVEGFGVNFSVTNFANPVIDQGAIAQNAE